MHLIKLSRNPEFSRTPRAVIWGGASTSGPAPEHLQLQSESLLVRFSVEGGALNSKLSKAQRARDDEAFVRLSLLFCTLTFSSVSLIRQGIRPPGLMGPPILRGFEGE